MSEWQPIETAPKDGTVLLLWGEFDDGGEPFIGWFEETDVTGDFGFFVWQQHEASSVAEGCVNFWMPLPEPPQ